MDWNAALTTFGLIFLAELGDKTQLAVLTQSCKYRCSWAVFLGATLALAVVTALGALGGQLVGRIVPARAIEGAAALMFVVMGALMAMEARKAGDEEGDSWCQQDTAYGHKWRAFLSTFWLLCIAEMGDKTQLTVLGLASRSTSCLPVFAGGVTALALVTALGVIGGQGLRRVIPRRILLWLSSLAFVGIGIWIWLGG
ncbi:MAG: TMEM165/GDT1 family protein [Anaerolineae bacterium]|nr:TMEM165/GDT1 family protein [Anaerolineae bacterium]